MTNTLSTINDSISELLSSLDENSDREILLPVIESLLQELKFNENANMISFRQLVADITSFILDSDQLENKNKKQFQWLKELTLAGHDITTLQVLVKALEHKTSYKSNEKPKEHESSSPNDEPSNFDFKKMIGIEPEEIEESLSEKKLIADENKFNETAIKDLKNNLNTRLDSTKNQSQEFEDLMQLLLTDLKEAKDGNELENIRTKLNTSINRLISENETISNNILHVSSELNRFENHCEQLNNELGLVKRLSLTDELTRLPNRRAFIKRLQNESGRVQRYGYSLSVAMLDLDLFKEINDAYGHAIGDEILQTYTKNILSTLRNYDLVARYGGEEFAILLPHTDIQGAERALNKVLEKTINATLGSTLHDAPIKLPSFSAGVALYKEGESIESVINRADKAMCSAKKMGRNRVMLETE